jgi:hypothetical protein
MFAAVRQKIHLSHCADLRGQLFHPLHYWSIFSGDAEIHLVYANNFLRGHPLQFNLNEANSGETSMGFTYVYVMLST